MSNQERKIEAFFYTDKSPQSDEAREMLDDAGVVYVEAVVGEDFNPNEEWEFPLLRTLEGEFVGIGNPEEEISNINTYIEIIQNRPNPR